MLCGLPPFYDEDVQKMYNLKMTADLEIPEYVDDDAADLIRRVSIYCIMAPAMSYVLMRIDFISF
jgi:hypothetical protein